jgi:hypothetical protein
MITAHFEGIEQQLIAAMMQAQYSVQICIAWMTAERYSATLNALADRGVKIEIAYYNDRRNIGIVDEFTRPEIDHFQVTPRGGALMHHKFCIIDDAVLVTGSYNWSKNAHRHFENIIVVRNDFELVSQYKHEFEDIKEFARGPKAGQRKRCFCCGSQAYHLAVFYPNDGHAPISNGVWLVCERRRHAKLIAHDTWTPDDAFESERLEPDEELPLRTLSVNAQRERMLRKFAAEREEMEFVRIAQARRFRMPIDAIGLVQDRIDDLGLKGNGGQVSWHHPEREIVVNWRAVYYRKTVPDILSDDGDFEQVVRGTDRWRF